MRMLTAAGKPSSDASSGVPANSLQLTRRGRYVAFYIERDRFKDAACSSNYMTSKYWMTRNNKLESRTDWRSGNSLVPAWDILSSIFVQDIDCSDRIFLNFLSRSRQISG